MENATPYLGKGKQGFLGTFLLQVMDVNALCDADNPTVAL